MPQLHTAIFQDSQLMRSLRERVAIYSLVGPLSLILFSGCGRAEKEPELAHAEGIVKINGQPAANILVQFLPKVKEGDPGPTSAGVTNEEGAFHLETADGKDGAVVGLCKVLFVDMAEERVPQGVTPKPARIPSSMAVPGPRTMEVEVKTENSAFDFDLKN